MTTTIKQEAQGAVNGVEGRFHNVIIWPQSGKIANQKWTSGRRKYNDGRESRMLQVEIRFDDSCKNGHESFAITATGWGELRPGTYREDSGGCLHDDIAKVFPELAPLIKWHLCSTDGPLHYIANTTFFAGDLDHNGLAKGESRQLRNGRTGELCWELVAANSLGIGISDTDIGRKYRGAETLPLRLLTESCEGESPPLATPKLQWAPRCRVGEGKARDLDAARNVAIWPEATDAELTRPKAELTALLNARLPALIAEFKAAVTGAGFLWEPPAC